jgi:hypothetical protein
MMGMEEQGYVAERSLHRFMPHPPRPAAAAWKDARGDGTRARAEKGAAGLTAFWILVD